MQAPCWEWCVTSCFPPSVWRKIDTLRRRAIPDKKTNLEESIQQLVNTNKILYHQTICEKLKAVCLQTNNLRIKAIVCQETTCEI